MNRRPISKWPLNERPREKLLKEGRRSLSDSELLAIILRLGTKGASAIDLAREVLGHFGGFRRMADADLTEWQKIRGLSTAGMVGTKVALQLEGEDAKVMAENLGLTDKSDRDMARTMILHQPPHRGLVRSNHFEPYIQADITPFWKKGTESK